MKKQYFFFKMNFGQHRVGLFHHLKLLGGNINVEKVEIGLIQGVGERATHIMTPDFKILSQISYGENESVPRTSDLLSVT